MHKNREVSLDPSLATGATSTCTQQASHVARSHGVRVKGYRWLCYCVTGMSFVWYCGYFHFECKGLSYHTYRLRHSRFCTEVWRIGGVGVCQSPPVAGFWTSLHICLMFWWVWSPLGHEKSYREPQLLTLSFETSRWAQSVQTANLQPDLRTIASSEGPYANHQVILDTFISMSHRRWFVIKVVSEASTCSYRVQHHAGMGYAWLDRMMLRFIKRTLSNAGWCHVRQYYCTEQYICFRRSRSSRESL